MIYYIYNSSLKFCEIVDKIIVGIIVIYYYLLVYYYIFRYGLKFEMFSMKIILLIVKKYEYNQTHLVMLWNTFSTVSP